MRGRSFFPGVVHAHLATSHDNLIKRGHNYRSDDNTATLVGVTRNSGVGGVRSQGGWTTRGGRVRIHRSHITHPFAY